MPHQRVPAVEPLRVLTVQLPHTSGQVAIHRLQQQVVVVAHLTKRMHHPVEALAGVAQNVEPVASVVVVQVNVFAPVTTGGDVVQGAGELKTKGTGHGGESTFNAGGMLKW